MPIREILQLGNPTLLEKSERVADIRAAALQSTILDLSDTLASFRAATSYGRAIAAPQLGILQRIIFVRMQPTGFCSALINPEIVWADSERMELWDDCFSFPELLVRVSRAARVTVDFYDEQGVQQRVEASGDLSELLQHEIDHLDGILAVERAVSPQAFCTRQEWLRRFRD
jgi:peptide deformylase